jgi:hypothetical protein
MSGNCVRDLFFLLDATEGFFPDDRLTGFRPKDVPFAESLGKQYAVKGSLSSRQFAVLERIVERYAWQVRRMPASFRVESSQAFLTCQQEDEDQQEKENLCLITDED